jgi:phosphatidylglycerophosphate synthase
VVAPASATTRPATTKPSKGVSLYSRWVNRPIGRLLARASVRVGLGANAVSTVSAALSALAIAVLVSFEPSWPVGISAALLLALGFAFDSADGQVARMTGTSSAAGEWLDHVIDSAKHVAIHAGVLVAWYRFLPEHETWLLLPLLFQFVAVVTFSGLTTAALLKRMLPTPPAGAGQPSMTRAIGLLPADFGVLCWLFVLWGSPGVFAGAYAVVFVLNAVILLAFLVKWFHELADADRARSTRAVRATADHRP